MKSNNKNPIHQETDCAKLARRNFYNTSEEDIDVPDGDIEFGKKLYQEQCVGLFCPHAGLTPSSAKGPV